MAGFWLMLPVAPFMTAVMVSGTLGVVGFMVPSFWLARAIKARQYKIRKAMPDALDLITIGVSAGLAFDGACGEIVEKWDNDLSHEFATMLGELRMGAGRRQALLNLTDRTQVDEIQIMASQLIQADELGMSLTDTLLTLANQMRQRRRQRAEELAHKAAVKMLIPLVFLIFPALFIVILGPAAQDMIGFVTGGP
jgi:tight adherence protein C